MTDETNPKWLRVRAAMAELAEASADYAGSPINKYLLVTGHENGRMVAGYEGCACAACRLNVIAAASREMGGRMHGVRLPDEPETIARIVDAAGRVH